MLNFLMSNEALFVIQLIVAFTGVVLAYKFFGKVGLFVWAGLLTVYANLEVNSFLTMFWLPVSLGNIGFCSLSFAQDIVNEKYGKDVAKKVVTVGLFSSLAVLALSQLSCLFSFDGGNFEAFHNVFAPLLPILITSLLSYFLSNRLNVLLYDWIRKRTDRMWIKTQFSSQIAQLFDTVFFTALCVLWEILAVKTGSSWMHTFFPTSMSAFVGLVITSYIIKAIVVLAEIPGMKVINLVESKYKISEI